MNDASRPILAEQELMALIEKAHWQSAKSVEHVPGGQHQYCVLGWSKDQLTEPEFWAMWETIRAKGRREIWVPPPGFYDSGNRRPMENTYLYLPDGFSYWTTWPRKSVPMLNREHVSVQETTPTRRPVPEQLRLEE